jgi:hypothetical protein
VGTETKPGNGDAQEIRLGEAMARITVDQGTGLTVPKSMEDQVALAAWARSSGLLPASITTTAQAWMVMQRGSELGFPGLTAFEFLYPVNGRVRLTPDGARAKALQSGLLEDSLEETVGLGENMFARVTVKRRGHPTAVVVEFSMKDAAQAGLTSKDNWRKYPKRMLLARARGHAFGDAFRDVIGGLPVREQYDLDPGERLTAARPTTAEETPARPERTATPDPLLAKLKGPAVKPSTVAKPVEAVLNALGGMIEKPPPAPEPVATCDHAGAMRHAAKKPGTTYVCECGEEVKLERTDLPISHPDAEPPPDWRPGGKAE